MIHSEWVPLKPLQASILQTKLNLDSKISSVNQNKRLQQRVKHLKTHSLISKIRLQLQESQINSTLLTRVSNPRAQAKTPPSRSPTTMRTTISLTTMKMIKIKRRKTRQVLMISSTSMRSSIMTLQGWTRWLETKRRSREPSTTTVFPTQTTQTRISSEFRIHN